MSDLVPVLQSSLTCPVCGAVTLEVMPVNACVVFYECADCRAYLRPKSGDCCVFCSYGTVPCPPIQMGGSKGACCG